MSRSNGPEGVCAFARGRRRGGGVALRAGTRPTLDPPGPGWRDVLGDRVPGVAVLEQAVSPMATNPSGVSYP